MRHVMVILVVVLAFCGCKPQDRIVWSPDGTTGAIFGVEGLYFCDANGKLSERIVSLGITRGGLVVTGSEGTQSRLALPDQQDK